MAKNNPYIETIDFDKINESEYGIIYDISTACRVHESKFGKFNTTHRSDIWARYCGLKLESHNMHLTSDKVNINNPSKKPIVLFSPFSTGDAFGNAKSLNNDQIREVVYQLKEIGYLIITINSERKVIFDELGVEQFIGLKVNDWIKTVNSVDYVITVDTANFHIAGGLKKPLVGIFTFTNGKIYGKYYDFILVQKKMDCSPCFNVSNCPKSEKAQKPCSTDLTASEIIQALDKAVKKWRSSENNQRNVQIDLPVQSA